MTRITPDEYKHLVPVPEKNWMHWNPKTERMEPNNLGPCYVSPEHGRAHYFLMSPDKRAIAACMKCHAEIEKAQAS